MRVSGVVLHRWVAAGIAALAMGTAPAALAASPEPHDFYLSLLGNSGVELFSDVRLFTLYSAFNALGYDQGPQARQDPLPRPDLTPLRARARAQLTMSLALQKRFQDFFDAHPLTRDAYSAYALALGPAPTFAEGTLPKDVASLAGFNRLLAAYEAEAHVAQAYAAEANELRALLKGVLAQLDPLCREEEKLLPAGPPSAIALNVLDDVAAVSVVGVGGEVAAVAGAPAAGNKGADLSSSAWAYAAARALPALSAGSLPAKVAELVQRVHRRGLPAGSLAPAVYVAQAYGAAVAAAVLPQQRQALLAEASDRGLWLAPELARLLIDEHGKSSPEELLGGRLASIDFRKLGPSTSSP